MDFFHSPSSKDIRDRKVDISSKKDIEPQEVFLDKLAQGKEEEIGVSAKKLEVLLSTRILQFSFLIFVILLAVLLGKAFHLQIVRGEEFSLLAEANKMRTHPLRAERGVIYDNSMRQLVFNKPSFDLVFDQRDFPWKEQSIGETLEEVESVLKKDLSYLIEEIERNYSPRVLVAENLDHEALILLETKINHLPGFEIEENTVREYVDGEVISHVVGYTGKVNREERSLFDGYSITDYIGKIGVEKSYEDLLRGEPGRLQTEKDALGNPISQEVVYSPQDGQSLVLWLDTELQAKIIEEIQKTLDRTGSKKAAAVAMDPRNGGILAVVSLPSFDNNLFAQGISSDELQSILADPRDPLFNRAISGTYNTGSTIKPLVAAAALEEGIITSKTTIDCHGFIEVEHQYDPEVAYYYRDWSTHGVTDVFKAIAESCNVFFYTIGGGYKNFKGLGAERLKKYLNLFGWGEEIAIDIPEANKGLIPDPEWKKANKGEAWYAGDTYHLAIGQGDMLVSPLQVAAAFASIANGGTLYSPRVVKMAVDSQKNLIKNIDSAIVRQEFISPENIQIVRKGMRQTVTAGSATSWLNSLPVTSAAKTGTAQVAQPNHYHNWVTVFAPYEEPEIVLTIVIENVAEAQVAALPVAQGVLGWYFLR